MKTFIQRYIRTLALLLLLLAGGAANEAGAKVTYHILSLPMSTQQLDGTRNIEGNTLSDFRTNVRVEVLRVVSTDLHVALPFEYKSPLVTTYHYYASDKITRSANPEQLYGYNNTKYYLYTINGSSANEDVPANQLTEDAVCEDNIDIYVTYDYTPGSSAIDLGEADLLNPNLANHKEYNIHLKDRMVVLNQKRQNRPGAVLDGKYTSEQLASNDFEWITSAGIGNGDGYRHFAFKFGGNDPYNVTIFTAFDKPYTYRETGLANFFTTYKKDRDKYYQKDVYKEYRGASFFSLMGAEITSNMWLSSEAHTQWLEGGTPDNANGKTVPGFFKGPNDNRSNYYEMSPIFNSFAILNHKSGDGSWAFAGTKMNTGTNNWQPRASDGQIQYLDYKDNGNNITIVYKAEASACKVDVYEVKKYLFRVVTPFGNNVDATAAWSDYAKDETITASMMPDELKRKYTSFTGNFYADAEHNTAVTTFDDAQTKCSTDASGRRIIYVGYEVLSSVPFTAIEADNKTTGYTSATWYEMTDKDSSGKKIKWDATNSVYKNNGGASEYNKESEFAFIGDPYELRIINRKLTADASANRYVGSDSRTTGTALTNNASDTGAGYKWEIPYDETSGSFTLREFGSTDAYWKWELTEGNTIQYATIASPATPTRIKVMELGKVDITYKVVDLAGNVAIEATEAVTPFTTLTGFANIPAAIRSPFLADETITFYDSYTDRNGDGKTNRLDWHNNTGGASEQTAITETPGTASTIYVAYTTSRLSSKNIKLIYSEQFNVKLNGEYIYWNSSDNKILSKAAPTTEELASNAYLWHLRGRDPYSMRIDNVGYSATLGSPLPTISATLYNTSGNGTTFTETVNNGQFVRVDGGTWGDDKALTWTSTRDDASRFIAMMSNNVGVYEVLAATGTSDYYRIGRASTAEAETKIYANTTYPHGADQLRFELSGTTEITYHLIDQSGTEIFTGEIKSKNPRLTLPSEFVSPLVEEYYYYPTSAKATTNLSGDRITEISQDTDESGGSADNSIYVRYKVGTDVGFGTSHPHLLKFLDPLKEGYYLEDGSDKLTTGKIQAIYPYCNGDGSLNIYGQVMRDEQMDGGSSTRPRWIWYFESANSDPYHVKIHSRSTISFGGRSNTTYLQTFAVHFNQDTDAPNKQHIVTGGNLIGITQDVATEYAILGVKNKYKLLTLNRVAADLNGDGDTSDTDENERRFVTSFEQYWKTYNMLKLCVLGIDKSTNEFSTDPSTFVVPSVDNPATDDVDESTFRATLAAKDWHSYNAVANATRWNGYNDVEGSSGLEKKKVERLEHWFQTFSMGDGTFDIEDADIPPVLVLLDRHGWEIMRKPIPLGDADLQADEKLAELRVFDSPMVKEYKFYSNANKDSGCHRYVLRIQNGAERDPIKVGGVHFTSTSLATLPPYVADRDLFVTYTVKEEYEKSYQPDLKTASKFIVLQNHQYAKDNSSTLTAVDAPSNISNTIIADDALAEGSKTFNQDCLWYVQPNSDIDTEMGYPGAAVSYTDDQNGFDPYNLQLKNASTSKFFTIDMKRSVLSGGVYTGDYTGGTLNVTLAAACTSPVASTESYDHSTLQMTNQTFMAVQDVNGNMQLMPRFDHAHRIDAFTTLAAPLAHATTADVDDASPGSQTTFMVRPLVFNYRILDNEGNVAMHYKAAGESYPSMPEHFKSPLAKDFKFYSGQAVYTATESTAGDWEAAGESFKKTAINNGGMNGQIRDFTTIGDYYFRVGSDTYTYTKVTVTNGNTTSSSNGIYDDVKEGRDISAREITSSFAAAGLQTSADIFIRYSYDEDHDTDNDNILQGRWMTMSLGGYNVQYDGTLNADGSGIFKDADPATKPATINSDAAAKKWQWKFLQSPCVSTSLYYKAPDPYAVRISNREANNGDPLDENSPMSIAIKVDDIDRFVLLAHPSGDYAFAAAGDELSYSFLNGASMTAPSTTPASIEAEGSFTKAANTISAGARVIFSNEVTHTFRYNIITNGKLLAAYEDQTDAAAFANHYAPLVPENIQSALINVEDYLYYGTAPLSDSKYTIDENSQIDNLYGLYDDIVYVHYPEFDRDKTPYLVPNERSSTSPVAVASTSNDVAIDLNGNLPYNIIWLSDNMMTSTDGSAISDGGDMSHQLSATTADMWHFTGNDPYAIKIKHESGDHYLNSTATLADESSAKTYMLLKHDGYDYGVLAESGNQGTMLSGYGQTTVTGGTAPTKFIPFALSVHHLIYHLVINTSNVNTSIPYRETKEGEEIAAKATWEVTDVTDIKGTTQRDLTSGSPAGTTYQLGSTINGLTYSYDAGKVGLGDVLNVPGCFDRPNCQFYYYIQDVYDSYNEGTHECSGMNTTLNNKYKGLKLEKLMSDGGLIGKTVVVNIAYKFDTGLETNAGGDFVTSTGQNLWYTFETSGATPKLAQYTGSLQTVSGYATHYTNDYLWTPLGDPYGFKMYNRYMHKNLTQTTTVMTTTSIADNQSLEMRSDNDANSVYELLADESTTAGYFLVHPVVNNDGTQYYMCDNGGTMKLSTTATEWTYGLSEDVMRPYYVGAGNVGGLNAAGKAAYEKAAAITDPFTKLVTLQDVVYNHDKADDDEDNYIVHYTPGYYRLHSQPGSEGLSTVRYASGYLHDIEKDVNKDGNEADAIPMHFYSRVGVNTTFEDEGGLTSGFTKTAATRGPIPVPATEYDPSSIFYFSGSSGSINISTQGLNVVGNKMTTSTGTSFTITDIGGGIIALSNSTNYLCYKQEGNIYDLKYGSYPSMESARWCMEPANNQGLVLTTNDGGEGYFYTTFCAPYDVLLPANSGSNSYYAYVCTAWDTEIIHPVKVRASDPYAEGKFVPAGTPVIIRTTDNTGKVQLTLPSSSPTSSLSCTFTGKYLEQLLATEITSSDKVYTFGLPITGYTITTTSGSDNGVIGSLVNREDSKTGVGFYVNANPNKELGDNTGAWTPNNRYVLHNKIYYRSGGSGASARSRIPAPQFIPVVFDGIEEVEQEGVQLTVEDDRVYDVHGRCIVSGEQARDGSWKKSVPSGVYLQGGKKYLIRKRTEM